MSTYERIPNLGHALDLVGAAYQEAMRNAGLLEGMITKVNALAIDQLRKIYTDVEREPGYTIMVSSKTVHLSGLRSVTGTKGRTCNAMTRAWQSFTPVTTHIDLKEAIEAMRAAAKKWDLYVCHHCQRATAWQWKPAD
ncbi:hypothetical protein [Actinomadura rayongensis]|uniref:Uncharacterized protein n=1 Tax=Actinomadura rayongensis TaxID=1429076 RepID=A0A6I4WFD6_9ACTN|nr:hypothetical protein [Actinomadura rayongensis]MXQ65272.1 hypothetical protein [Actinomadura rayongensis]